MTNINCTHCAEGENRLGIGKERADNACRASVDDELQTIGRPASMEALARRTVVHNSTRFSSTPRVANIPRYALPVHNALRRNQALSDPYLCPKPHFSVILFHVCVESLGINAIIYRDSLRKGVVTDYGIVLQETLEVAY